MAGSVRATWLADAARLTGYPVVEVGGWRGRGHGGFRSVEVVVGHHTADGPTGDYPSLGVVTHGRAGLAGPLANLGLARSGTVLVIADGVAFHAGPSRWAGLTGLNDQAIGIEAESVGTRDDWTPAQRDCYPRLAAACLYHMRRPASRFCGHKECALPPGRKIDPAFWDLDAFRARVAWMLDDPTSRIPGGPEEDFLMALSDAQQQQIYDVIAQAYARTGRGLGDLLADIWQLAVPGVPQGSPHPGTLGNAVVSMWAQEFFGSQDFGASLLARLDALEEQLAEVRAAVVPKQG